VLPAAIPLFAILAVSLQLASLVVTVLCDVRQQCHFTGTLNCACDLALVFAAGAGDPAPTKLASV
jgi:hypothetical protein